MKHHFTRNVSALETSDILIWSKWLIAVFSQMAVDINNIVYLCLDAGGDNDVFKDECRKGSLPI